VSNTKRTDATTRPMVSWNKIGFPKTDYKLQLCIVALVLNKYQDKNRKEKPRNI
jgi:hypothetical protein